MIRSSEANGGRWVNQSLTCTAEAISVLHDRFAWRILSESGTWAKGKQGRKEDRRGIKGEGYDSGPCFTLPPKLDGRYWDQGQVALTAVGRIVHHQSVTAMCN